MKTLFVSVCALALVFAMVEFAHAQGTETDVGTSTDPLEATEAQSMEQEASDLLSVMKSDGNFTWFVEKLEQTGLAQDLQNGGPYTVFAPTDRAVEASKHGKKEATESYGSEQADPRLIQTLRFHMAPGSITLDQLMQKEELSTVSEEKLKITTDGQAIEINGAQIVSPGLTASNGIIHGIDALLEPPSESMSEASPGSGS